jgi:hypothetical protein
VLFVVLQINKKHSLIQKLASSLSRLYSKLKAELGNDKKVLDEAEQSVSESTTNYRHMAPRKNTHPSL